MLKNKKLKIALIAPPFGETGGPEVVTKNLARALSERDDINVTLFCPGDWHIKTIKRIDMLKKSLWNLSDFKEQTKIERRNLIIWSQLKALRESEKFDIIHLNSQPYAFLTGKMSTGPVLLTLHSNINARELKQITSTGIKTVSITKRQRKDIKASSMVWNGVPTKEIIPSFEKGKFLIAIGRLAEQKGIDIAIEIAKKANKKLLIFGRVGNSEERQKYFNNKIKPFIDDEQIIYKKEVSHKKIYEYLRNAEALLFTIKKPETFGMVVAEALACGTPVIGTCIDPLPEILKSKKVSYLSNNISELVTAVENIDNFNRRKCRLYAEKYFDSSVMAEKYVKIYNKLRNDN